MADGLKDFFAVLTGTDSDLNYPAFRFDPSVPLPKRDGEIVRQVELDPKK